MSRKNGFMLVYVAIALTLLAIGFLGAKYARNFGTANKIYIEKSKSAQDKIMIVNKAILSFVAKNYRFPCPADPTVVVSNPNFGTEVRDPATNMCNLPHEFSVDFIYGAVPVKALGLPSDYMFDPYDNRFSYVVNRNYSLPNLVFYTKYDGINLDNAFDSINIKPSGGLDIAQYLTIKGYSSAMPITEKAMYVLIGHGQNGFGAWDKNGKQLKPSSLDSYENENIFSFGKVNNTFIKDTAQQTYDDEVLYITKDDLVSQIIGNAETYCGTRPANVDPSVSYPESHIGTTSTVNCSCPGTTETASCLAGTYVGARWTVNTTNTCRVPPCS